MAGLGSASPDWLRQTGWSAGQSRLALAVLAALLVLTALVPIDHSGDGGARPRFGLEAAETGKAPATFDDLAMYRRIIARLQHGERYHDAAIAEHRATGFPLRPGIAVRLPTLAWLSAWLGKSGLALAAWALFLAVPLVWWRKLGAELPEGPAFARLRIEAVLLLLVGMSIGLTEMLATLHEVWAGGLLALSLGLHGRGKWGASLVAAGLALAIRELALPYVLLMAAAALWQRDWRQGAAWAGLAALFLAGLGVHLQAVAALAQPGDLVSPGWITFRGPGGWLSNLVLPSQLLLLPEGLAKALVVAALFGWASWRSGTAAFAALLFAGYGLLFMVAGRDENHYWGATVAPLQFAGLAFAPRGLMALWRSATPGKIR